VQTFNGGPLLAVAPVATGATAFCFWPGPKPKNPPYLYWARQAETAASPCQANGPADDFEWNFCFGNGFQGTNLLANNLYVIVYYPDSATKNSAHYPQALVPVRCLRRIPP